MAWFGRRVDGVVRTLMLHRGIRRTVSHGRYLWLKHIKRYPGRMHVFEDESDHAKTSLKETIDHNFARIVAHGFNSPRGYRMGTVVSCVTGVKLDGEVLYVGPRTEVDLLTLYGHGFRWGGLRGFDLFSYSPKIDVGDMHDFPYDDDTFDVSFHSWALNYSHRPRRACEELARVTRPGGIICMGASYTHHRGTPIPPQHCIIKSLDEVEEMFGDAVGEVVWREQDPGHPFNLTLVFRVAK